MGLISVATRIFEHLGKGLQFTRVHVRSFNLKKLTRVIIEAVTNGVGAGIEVESDGKQTNISINGQKLTIGSKELDLIVGSKFNINSDNANVAIDNLTLDKILNLVLTGTNASVDLQELITKIKKMETTIDRLQTSINQLDLQSENITVEINDIKGSVKNATLFGNWSFGKGALPVARIGDTVATPSGPGTITGSPSGTVSCLKVGNV